MSLSEIMQKKERLVIGLMSGTSADGVDAALVHMEGCGENTKLRLIAYISVPFEKDVREQILKIAEGNYGGSAELCRMNVRLGYLYLDACKRVCSAAKVKESSVDLVGCHGQTVYHQPSPEIYLGQALTSTLQIGDPSVICEGLGTIAVSDFRVRDMAAGGQGAPLVPYTEYLIYRDPGRNIALQNIGGIGNITYIPKGAGLGDVTAFDTGPGNMLIDAAVSRYSQGRLIFDQEGRIAASYAWDERLLTWLMEEPYLKEKPPKTTGRERYNRGFVEKVYTKAASLGVQEGEVLTTFTRYTALTIAFSVKEYLPAIPERLIVGGGGSYNLTLLRFLKELLPETEVVTNEEIGWNSDAKEAVAFAILANEAVSGMCNNAPGATGAAHPVIMGKISQ